VAQVVPAGEGNNAPHLLAIRAELRRNRHPRFPRIGPHNLRTTTFLFEVMRARYLRINR
jgi:hypothetical protein